MLDSANIFEQIRQSLNAVDIAQELGVEVSSGGKTLCIFHEERTPSLMIYSDGFKCFGCGKTGSVLDLYMRFKDCDIITAGRALAAKAGLEWPEKSDHSRRVYEESRSRSEAVQKRVRHWQGKLRPEDLEYLKGRGFSQEFIAEQAWGFCDRKVPDDSDKARNLGLISANDWYLPYDRIVLPLLEHGDACQLVFHRAGSQPKYLYAMWPKPLVRARRGKGKASTVPVLAEGVFDYFSLLQASIPTMTGLGTQLSHEQLAQLRKVGPFVIAFDGDEAGHTAGMKLAREFYPDARLIQLPRGKDVNDLLQDLGPARFKDFFHEAIAGAKDWLAIKLDELENNATDQDSLKEILACTASIPSSVQQEQVLDRIKSITKISKSALRKDMAGNKSRGGEEDPKQADVLIRLAEQSATLFHSDVGETYAHVAHKGHREIWPIRGEAFRLWLVRTYYFQTGKSPNSESVREALGVLAAKARYDGATHKLSLRVARHDGAIWYDLANDAWQAIRITEEGWEVIDNPPILFQRFANTAPQVIPERGGTLDRLDKYINLKNEDDRTLLTAVCIAYLLPDVPRPIAVFYGSQGAAKTTSQRVIRRLIDPAVRDTMAFPRDKSELALQLTTNYAPCFDNLDSLSSEQSDTLCCAVSGGGVSKRKLYTDMDEIILSYKRCIMLNGINVVATRADLLDRSILFQLERIGEGQRKEEAEFWAQFTAEQPQIFGAMLDALVAAMRIHGTVKLSNLPRMADFARWGFAITEALHGQGKQFVSAYRKNISGAVEQAVQEDPVCDALLQFMHGKHSWTGTPTELHTHLSSIPGIDAKSRGWPKRAHTLTKRINKMKTSLTEIGIAVRAWHNGQQRSVTISRGDTHEESENAVSSVSRVSTSASPYSDLSLPAQANNTSHSRASQPDPSVNKESLVASATNSVNTTNAPIHLFRGQMAATEKEVAFALKGRV